MFSKSLVHSTLNSIFGPITSMCNGHRILLYHSIQDYPEDDIYKLNTVSLHNFREQMQFLVKNNYVITPLLESFKKKSVSISFDDGYKTNLYQAAPILFELNIPFTIFISTEKLNLGHNEYLNKEELKELSKNRLVTFGTHGHTHKPLSQLTLEELKIELKTSKSILEYELNKRIDYLSYPHGLYNNEIIQCAKDIGYKYAFSSLFGFNNINTNKFLIKRTVILNNDSIYNFEQKLKGFLDWKYYMQINTFNKKTKN